MKLRESQRRKRRALPNQYRRIDEHLSKLTVTRTDGTQHHTFVSSAMVPVLQHWKFYADPRSGIRTYFKARWNGRSYYLHRLIAELKASLEYSPGYFQTREVHHAGGYSYTTPGTLRVVTRSEHRQMEQAKRGMVYQQQQV